MDVRWSKNAKCDLKEIILYYKKERTLRAAKKISNQIQEAVKTLKDFPLMAALDPDLSEGLRDFRCLVVTKVYKIIYYIEVNTIVISAVFDCRQDPDKLIKDIQE